MAVVFSVTDPECPDDLVPFIALHFIEHSIFVWFDLTSRASGGLNVNLFDRCVRLMKVSITTVRKLIAVINSTLEAHPHYRLPIKYDTEAWYRTFSAIVPPKQMIHPSYLRAIILGQQRGQAYSKLSCPAIDAYASSSAVGTSDGRYWLTPMSESCLLARKSYAYGISENSHAMQTSKHPVRALEQWEKLLSEQAARFDREEAEKERQRKERKEAEKQQKKREKQERKERAQEDAEIQQP